MRSVPSMTRFRIYESEKRRIKRCGSTWKLQPAIGVTNITSGPFALRNRNTDGTWVVQGKRPQLRATLSPTFFGFVGGVGLEAVRRGRGARSRIVGSRAGEDHRGPRLACRGIGADDQRPLRRALADRSGSPLPACGGCLWAEDFIRCP